MAAALSSSFMAPTCSTIPESMAGPAESEAAATRGTAGARFDVRAGTNAGAGASFGGGVGANEAADATAKDSSGLEEASVTFGTAVSRLWRLAPVLPIWYPRKTRAHDKITTATKSSIE